MNKAKKAGTVIISVLLWIIILVAALYSVTVLVNKDGNNVSSIGGFSPLIIESNSMAPTFEKGDLIIIRKCDTSKLQEGDIITFHTVIENELALNTHRIVKIEEVSNGYRSYVTRGDNNAVDDEHILMDGDIVGKHVSTLPKVGKVMNFLSSNVGFLAVIVIPMLLFFIYQLYHLITVVIALKKATALEAIEEQARIKVEAEQRAAKMAAEQAAQQRAAQQRAQKEAQIAAQREAQRTAEQAAQRSVQKDTQKDELEKALAEAVRAKEEALAEAMRAKEEAERVLAEIKSREGNGRG